MAKNYYRTPTLRKRTDVSSCSESSEIEFWEELEETASEMRTQSTAGRPTPRPDPSSRCTAPTAAAESQCELVYGGDALEVMRVRAAHRVQILNDRCVARAQVRSEFEEALEAQRRQHEQDLATLLDTCDSIRMMAIGKDVQIIRLKEVLSEQEVIITALRLGVFVDTTKQSSQALSQGLSIESLKSECVSLHEKINAFTDITRLLKSENAELNEKLTDAKLEIKEKTIEFDEKLECVTEAATEKYNSLQEKYQEILKVYAFLRFDEYKTETEKEFAVQEEVIERQNALISQLQEQLKAAKMLLQTSPKGRSGDRYVSSSPKSAGRARFQLPLRIPVPSTPQLPRYPVKVVDLNLSRLNRTFDRTFLAQNAS